MPGASPPAGRIRRPIHYDDQAFSLAPRDSMGMFTRWLKVGNGVIDNDSVELDSRAMELMPAVSAGSFCQGSNWRLQARAAAVLAILGLVSVIALAGGLSSVALPGLAGLFGAGALLWEWRMRRMGIRLTEDGIDLVGPLSTVHEEWAGLREFVSRPVGTWDDAIVIVRRERRSGKLLGGRDRKLPTISIISQGNPVGRWFGPCDLSSGDLRIPQNHVVTFLNEQLAIRRARV